MEAADNLRVDKSGTMFLRSGQPNNDISFKQRHIQRSLSTDLLRELALEKSSHMPAIHGNLHLFWSILSIDIALGDPT